MTRADSLVEQYKMIAPESTPDQKIWDVYCDCDGDDNQVQEIIGSWYVWAAGRYPSVEEAWGSGG